MTATYFLVGEAWGSEEELMRYPFVGPSGAALISMLEQAGILVLTGADRANIREYWRSRNSYFNKLVWEAHPEIHLTNVFNFRPQPANDIKHLCGDRSTALVGYPALQPGKYVHAKYTPELARLSAEAEARKPNCIIALGATATWALLRTSGIRQHRGAVTLSSTGRKVLPTYHPAAVLRDWSLRGTVIADLTKAVRENRSADLIRPRRSIWIEPSLDDLDRFRYDHLRPADEIAADIETLEDTITCIGFAPSPKLAIVIPFFDYSKPGRNYWPDASSERSAWAWVKHVLSLPKRFVFQNGLFDLHFLWRTMGITCPGAADDTMLCHHALQPELLKSLDFLGSIYTDEARWKFMRKSSTIKREG